MDTTDEKEPRRSPRGDGGGRVEPCGVGPTAEHAYTGLSRRCLRWRRSCCRWSTSDDDRCARRRLRPSPRARRRRRPTEPALKHPLQRPPRGGPLGSPGRLGIWATVGLPPPKRVRSTASRFLQGGTRVPKDREVRPPETLCAATPERPAHPKVAQRTIVHPLSIMDLSPTWPRSVRPSAFPDGLTSRRSSATMPLAPPAGWGPGGDRYPSLSHFICETR